MGLEGVRGLLGAGLAFRCHRVRELRAIADPLPSCLRDRWPATALAEFLVGNDMYCYMYIYVYMSVHNVCAHAHTHTHSQFIILIPQAQALRYMAFIISALSRTI